MVALQGIWHRDLPALASWRETDKRARALMDAAGHVFICTFCFAVRLAVVAGISPMWTRSAR
eukprot:11208179-Lingulodinium_polyedra.AAC.1